LVGLENRGVITVNYLLVAPRSHSEVNIGGVVGIKVRILMEIVRAKTTPLS